MITIKKANLSRVLTVAHTVVAQKAAEYRIRPIEMRVLMFIVDTDGSRGQGVESVTIEDQTGIKGSNVRKALYELAKAGMVEFLQNTPRILVTQTARGLAVAQECSATWESMMKAA